MRLVCAFAGVGTQDADNVLGIMAKLPELPDRDQRKLWKLLGKLMADVSASTSQGHPVNTRNSDNSNSNRQQDPTAAHRDASLQPTAAETAATTTANAAAVRTTAQATSNADEVLEIESDSSVEVVAETRRPQLHPTAAYQTRRLQLHPNAAYETTWQTYYHHTPP